VSLRYRAYANNAAVQQALLDGKVDMLIGVAPSPTRTLQMQFTSELMALPRAVLLTGAGEPLPGGGLWGALGLRLRCQRLR
jgi:hypothetical protein